MQIVAVCVQCHNRKQESRRVCRISSPNSSETILFYHAVKVPTRCEHSESLNLSFRRDSTDLPFE